MLENKTTVVIKWKLKDFVLFVVQVVGFRDVLIAELEV